MNEGPAKASSRRPIIIGGLIGAGIICLFVVFPCAVREIGSRAVLGRDISNWTQVDSAIRVYRMERGHYPGSLNDPEFQTYLGEHVVAFLRDGRVTYHFPAADSPPTFVLVHMTTPRGSYSTQLDGTRLYPNFK